MKHSTSPDPTLALFDMDSITGHGLKKISERYYQIDAVKCIGLGLRAGGRGQLRSACGTGKTVMAQRSAELLCPTGGVVAVVCPSIALVGQTLREWAATNDDHIAIAVCGDETVTDTMIKTEDLPAQVTTDPQVVADWLRAPTTAGLRLIVGTHVSAHVIGEALSAAGKVADLLVVDEAHRAAGQVDKHTALVHDDERLPAARRLYATATPRVIGEKAIYRYRNGRGAGGTKSFDKQLIGMDDANVFGPVLYEYSFSQAIDDGYLDDYRLLVMGVTKWELMQYLADLPRGATTGDLATDLHTAMVQTVVAKAARQYGLRRVLAFCNQLNEAADFARSMNRTLAALPEHMRPESRLTTAYVHGGLNSAEREQRLGLLVEPPEDGWTVVSNVRCLTEGVDVPSIDCVVFTRPKQSVIEIVQGIGRALRRDPNGTGTATILVPIMLPDEPGDIDEADLADYRLLYQVVRALRAHDHKLGATIDRATISGGGHRYVYEERELEHVRITLPDGYDNGSVLQHLTAKLITSARHPWWDGYAAMRDYHAEHGDCLVRSDHVTEQGHKLGAWAENTRVLYRKGLLAAERITALEELDFDFHPRAVEWAEGIKAATIFHAQYGHLEPVRSLRVDGVELLSWLHRQRTRAAAGELAESRRAALDALGMRWHAALETFEDYLAALTDHHARHGTIDILPDPNTPDGRLGSWQVSMRIQRKMSKLTDAQISALDALGMQWSPPKATLPQFSAGQPG